MKRKLTSLLLALALLLSLTACGASGTDPASGGGADSTDDSASGQQPSKSAPARSTSALRMRVNSSTGEMQMERSVSSDGAVEEDGVWTIFVYLCGTDLESDAGLGTDDLIEMCEAETGEQVRFVVQTGGAREWATDQISSNKAGRFLIQDGGFEQVDAQSLENMGRPETLCDFLQWGVEEYASEHMGLILWNHGGGSITGVCFDERNGYDSLDLKELDTALYRCCDESGRRFDFIGFDACLMGTVETANILASYADYMIGSEETEPGSGWDYTAIGRYLDENPGADAASLGRVICDGFVASCAAVKQDDLCTLSVIDLNRLDEFLTAFNAFAKNMYEAGADGAIKTEMLRAVGAVDNFGGNNKSEGYTNMVDLGGIIASCSQYADGAEEALRALDDVVVYFASGSAHRDASGLSTYYPLSIQGSKEMSIFGGVCVSPYYLSFVDRQSQSGVNKEDADDYDSEQWFDEDGEWSWGDAGDDSYWGYLEDYEQTGESPYITFEDEPQLDEDGTYWFALDDDGYKAALDVYGIVYQISPDGEDLIELGETYDIDGDWETGVFMDDFDGWWISLPDGQNLATHIVEDAEDYTIYTSPVRLNGEDTNLRLKMDYSGDSLEMIIEGAWDGLSEYGAASRNIIELEEGDVIIPLYDAYSIEDFDEVTYFGEEYTFDGEPELCYDYLDDGDYLFSFCIEDIYGDYYLTDSVMFNVEDGEVWYYEE